MNISNVGTKRALEAQNCHNKMHTKQAGGVSISHGWWFADTYLHRLPQYAAVGVPLDGSTSIGCNSQEGATQALRERHG